MPDLRHGVRGENDLRGIARAIALSHRTMRNIKQNLFFAFVYNSVISAIFRSTQLGDELGHVAGQGDRLGETLLLRAGRGELGLESGGVGVVLGELRGDLRADVGENHLEHAIGQHMLLQVIDEGRLDVAHRLLDRDWADLTAALCGVVVQVLGRRGVAKLLVPGVKIDSRSSKRP